MPVDSPEDLYGLPLEQFIAERAALAKALRGEKRRDEAKQVGALRKPSVAAWAVNQLVRTQGQELRGLFQAGDDLVAAQTAAAEGKRAGDEIRDASRRQREAISALLQAAEGLLSSDGQALSQTTLERVGDTLRAAAIDQEARRQVESACLTHELRFVGLGLGGPSTTPPKPPSTETRATRKPKADRRRQERDAEAERRQQEQAAEAERQRAAARKAARQAETGARRTATRAEKELAAAQAHHAEAATALAEAERRLTAAETRVRQAATELANAERAVHDLRSHTPTGSG